MNAPDSSTPQPRIASEACLSRLRKAIATRLREPEGGENELRAALQEVAAEAKARSLRPEELIVSLKMVLGEAAAEKPRSDLEEQRRLKEWLVKACIQAYFGK
ncbi:MAG TPA: hypothetical protein VMM18_15260 [Gemmatimonadaceae bacterium]|nr:hypothetical protein [Gemmatimonadaceae bacterium]